MKRRAAQPVTEETNWHQEINCTQRDCQKASFTHESLHIWCTFKKISSQRLLSIVHSQTILSAWKRMHKVWPKMWILNQKQQWEAFYCHIAEYNTENIQQYYLQWGENLFDPLLILYVCPLTKKWSVYHFNGRFIWTVRDRITTKKSRKMHLKKVRNSFAF